jgi:hypothetical protein
MTKSAQSSVIDVRQRDLEHGRLLFAVSPNIEPSQDMRMRRMEEIDALARHLYDRLVRDGFWPSGAELLVTLGAKPQEAFGFATPLPGYSSSWDSKQFEDATCLSSRRFIRAIAPSAPVKRYLAEFNRLGRRHTWSHEARSSRLAGRLDLSMTRERFEASLTVTGPAGVSTFPVFQCEADASNWIELFGKMSVTNRRVTIAAETGQVVRVVRTGRTFVSWTGKGRDRQRFVVDVGASGAKVLREFVLKRLQRRKHLR